MTTHKKYNEGSEYESLEFEGNRTKLRVESKDTAGDVEFEMETYGESGYVYLNQEQAKLLIAHLQKQII